MFSWNQNAFSKFFNVHSSSIQLYKCSSCERKKSMGRDTGIMWKWLRSKRDDRSLVKQAMSQYETIYKKTVLQELWDIGVRDGNEVDRLVESAIKRTCINTGRMDQDCLVNHFRLEIEYRRRMAFTNWNSRLELAS